MRWAVPQSISESGVKITIYFLYLVNPILTKLGIGQKLVTIIIIIIPIHHLDDSIGASEKYESWKYAGRFVKLQRWNFIFGL